MVGVQWFLASALIALVLPSIMAVQAAGSFATPAFQQQWQQGEAIAPNFWGPLATARDGQHEPYKEAPGGQRLVQYFDKTRMELTNPASGIVTNGLLTVELKTGRLQVGDNAFEQRQPAQVNIAGDPGTDGPTYADLAQLQEHFPHKDQIDVGLFRYAHGRFDILPLGDPLYDVLGNPSVNTLGAYTEDPAGRYGQYVFPPFADYIRSLPLPMDQTTGYPIAPLFVAEVKIAGIPTYVAIQAFERRVLTYNPGNANRFKVEFGNIGQHYYTWRYGAAPPLPSTPPPSTAPDFSPFAQRWGHHGYQLIVNTEGNAHADWRTYEDCSTPHATDVPCENPYTSYAGHATLQFTTVQGQTAVGQVTTSNDLNFQRANVTVTLTLKPYDMAELRQPTGESLDLCGPDFSKLAPPSLIEQSPCGA